MAINTYGVKTGEFGQYDIADFRPLSLRFQEQWRTCKIVQSSSLEYGEKKENTSEETEAASPKKLKMSAKGGHEHFFKNEWRLPY